MLLLVDILNVVVGVSFLREPIGGVASKKRRWDMGHTKILKVVVIPHEVQVQQGHYHSHQKQS